MANIISTMQTIPRLLDSWLGWYLPLIHHFPVLLQLQTMRDLSEKKETTKYFGGYI